MSNYWWRQGEQTMYITLHIQGNNLQTLQMGTWGFYALVFYKGYVRWISRWGMGFL